jgi:hypothetical protein
VGLLDELAKALEEAQQQAEGRRRAPAPRPRYDRSEADIEDENDGDDVVVVRSPPPRRRPQPQPQPEVIAPEPDNVPPRTVSDSPVALAPHEQSGPPPVERIRALVKDAASVRDVFIAREILGPPPGLTRWRRGRQTPRRG